MKNLLKLMDLSEKEIVEILNTADQLKFEKKNGIPHRLLEGKVLGLIFAKSSTRTRVSFEVGMFDLGGTSLFLSSRDLQIGRGEIVQDTARVLSRYLDGIMIRTFDQREVEALAEFGTIPIINGLTDYCHPCQVLADLMTIREYKGNIKGRKLCYIGDGNNMTNSLIVGGIKLGMEVSVACPAGYEPDADIMRWAYESGRFSCSSDVLEMAQNSDVLYTDVWASMGQEGEADPTQWCCIVSPLTARRRSPQRCSRSTPARSSTRRRTASTPKRPSSLSVCFEQGLCPFTFRRQPAVARPRCAHAQAFGTQHAKNACVISFGVL